MSDTITEEDKKAFYEAQDRANPDEPKPWSADAQHAANQESGNVADAMISALDVPKQMVLENLTVTVKPPTLGALLKAVQAFYAAREASRKRGDEMFANELNDVVDNPTGYKLNLLMAVMPEARSLFLSCLELSGGEAWSEDEKWDWFANKLNCFESLDVAEMFLAHVDWKRLLEKVQSMMGKLTAVGKK